MVAEWYMGLERGLWGFEIGIDENKYSMYIRIIIDKGKRGEGYRKGCRTQYQNPKDLVEFI